MIKPLRETEEERALVVKREAKALLSLIDKNSSDNVDILRRLELIEIFLGLRTES